MISKRHEFTLSKINTQYLDEALFNKARSFIAGINKGSAGIGTYMEKGVHSLLKYYYVPDSDCHEVIIDDDRRFVADACKEGEIYEIQSKQFYKMRGKLEVFLKDHDVTIVYPIALTKRLIYIDPETGELSKPRISSKKGCLYDVVSELYSIKGFLDNPKLHFIMCFIEMDEYKLLDGWSKDKKKGATKTDRFATKILGEFRINEKRDLLTLLPGVKRTGKRAVKSELLPKEFTSKDVAESSGCSQADAGILLNILCHIKLIEKTGKKGRSYTYKLH